jgi:hypothetical protein
MFTTKASVGKLSEQVPSPTPVFGRKHLITTDTVYLNCLALEIKTVRLL